MLPTAAESGAGEHGYTPQPPYSPADRLFLARRDTGSFFIDAATETHDMGTPGKHLKGPYFSGIEQILHQADTAIARVDAAFTATHLLAQVDLPPQEFEQVTTLPPDTFSQLALIRRHRLESLYALGERLNATETTCFNLSAPPYHFQGDGQIALLEDRGCANACFRMVYEGVTHQAPHEFVVMEAMQAAYNSAIVEDEAYLRLFHSPTFTEAFADKPVKTLTITGANLQTIAKLREKLGATRNVYGIIDLQTQNVETGQWHTSVLLGADEDNIFVHDPSQKTGGPEMAIPKQEFYKRWAVGYNRAHLVITEAA